jgi:hypothetical protein
VQRSAEWHALKQLHHLHDDERRALWLPVLVVVHLNLRQVKIGGRHGEKSAAEIEGKTSEGKLVAGGV